MHESGLGIPRRRNARRRIRATFEGAYRLKFHLAAPLPARRDPETGPPRKPAYGAWMLVTFGVPVRLKGLGATRFDLFGRSAERRMERRLIVQCAATIAELRDDLGPENHAVAVQIAEVPARIRGFGHVKQRQLAAAKSHEAAPRAAFRNPRPLARAPGPRGGVSEIPTRGFPLTEVNRMEISCL